MIKLFYKEAKGKHERGKNEKQKMTERKKELKTHRIG